MWYSVVLIIFQVTLRRRLWPNQMNVLNTSRDNFSPGRTLVDFEASNIADRSTFLFLFLYWCSFCFQTSVHAHNDGNLFVCLFVFMLILFSNICWCSKRWKPQSSKSLFLWGVNPHSKRVKWTPLLTFDNTWSTFSTFNSICWFKC